MLKAVDSSSVELELTCTENRSELLRTGRHKGYKSRPCVSCIRLEAQWRSTRQPTHWSLSLWQCIRAESRDRCC